MSNAYKEEIIALAIILDFILGDPLWLYHPVRLIGFLANKLEKLLRKTLPYSLKLAGVILNITIVGGTFAFFYFVSLSIFKVNYYLGFGFEAVFIYFSLAINSLTKEGRIIKKMLANNQTAQAKARIRTLVSRDLSQESRNGLIRATLETFTENLSDGVIAPLFFAMLGGAPLAMTYKAVNTLDSMVGYKNERYKDLGWFSAKLDDIVNYIPARITGLLIIFSSAVLLKHPLKALKAWRNSSKKCPSPNGGIPIATFAGAMNIILGGDCYDKEGRVVKIPEVGAGRKELLISDIKWVNIFIYLSASVMTAAYFLLMLWI